MHPKRWPLLGLAALAAVTALLVILAFLHVRPTSVQAEPARSANSTTTTPTTTPPPSPPTRAPSGSPPSPSAPGTPAATPPAPPPASPTPRERMVEAIRNQLRTEGNVNIVVLGDASGAGDAKWVGQWAQSLSATRRVELRTSAGGRTDTRTLGSASRSAVLTNVSEPALTLRDATNRFDQLVPPGADLVILNFGHRESEGSISADLEKLWGRIPATASGLVVLQNPERGDTQQAQRNRVRALGDWAKENKAPVVNVFDAFVRAPEPLSDLVDRDGILPSDAGNRVWKDELVRQIG